MRRVTGITGLADQVSTTDVYRKLTERPGIPRASTVPEAVTYLQLLVCDVPTIGLTAKFAFEVLRIYKAVPMYIPLELMIRED